VYNQRVKIEVQDCETGRTATISFAATPEMMEISIAQILLVGLPFAKTGGSTSLVLGNLSGEIKAAG